jgi:hypothetical protein
MAGFFAKDKNGNSSVNVAMISGIDSIAKNMPVTLTLLDDSLEIKQRVFKKEPFTLAYAQITNAGMVRSQQIVESDTSVIGRAVVGNLFFGPLGAIVGGMSGTGKKYFVINYTSAASGEPQVLAFWDNAGNLPGMMKNFIAELREKAGLSEPDQTPTSHTL